ncbi:prophage endopeptidase tail family protein [Limosilactobacillus oris]|uniref:prophage endopeptidase tail family protein n=1 Tax=Limosilactobacillus oris TaxID=1632 RepID=UPI00223629F9|nr:prophage endopeptidase tail family protein [Limosilactobacillus oris]MCW4387064.1 phage tail protein [Limosilactobacillus oris]
MSLFAYVQARDSDRGYRVNYADLVDSFEFNYQISNNYEISFTMTYVEEYKEAFNAAKAKGRVYEDGKWFTIQQADTEINSQGLLTLKVTANHELIDKMKNLRLDKKEPTEDNPETSGGGSGSGQDDNQDKPEVTIKKTAEKKTYPLKDRLDQFFNNNDQGINYRLQGNFPEVAVDCDGSLYEWLGSHLKDFSAYWWPDGNTLVISDLPSMQRKTGQAFRYQYNVTNAQVQLDANNIVNDCMVYGGKMEKDITSGGPGGGGDLDSVEGFASSPINADFGVNKQFMLQDFAAKDHRVQAWGVDVSRLYDTIKGQGISPEWFLPMILLSKIP